MKAESSSSSNEALVTRSQAGALLTLSLNRGESFNPLSSSMIAALENAFDEVAEDSSVRVIVLRGEGRGFCAGHDLRELRDFGQDAARHGRYADAVRKQIHRTDLREITLNNLRKRRRQDWQQRQ